MVVVAVLSELRTKLCVSFKMSYYPHQIFKTQSPTQWQVDLKTGVTDMYTNTRIFIQTPSLCGAITNTLAYTLERPHVT